MPETFPVLPNMLTKLSFNRELSYSVQSSHAPDISPEQTPGLPELHQQLRCSIINETFDVVKRLRLLQVLCLQLYISIGHLKAIC